MIIRLLKYDNHLKKARVIIDDRGERVVYLLNLCMIMAWSRTTLPSPSLVLVVKGRGWGTGP